MHPILTHTLSPATSQGAGLEPSKSQTPAAKPDGKRDSATSFANVFESSGNVPKTQEHTEQETTLLGEDGVELATTDKTEGQVEDGGPQSDFLTAIKQPRPQKRQELAPTHAGTSAENTNRVIDTVPRDVTHQKVQAIAPETIKSPASALATTEPVAPAAVTAMPTPGVSSPGHTIVTSLPVTTAEAQQRSAQITQVNAPEPVEGLLKHSDETPDFTQARKDLVVPAPAHKTMGLSQQVPQPDQNMAPSKAQRVSPDQALIQTEHQTSSQSTTLARDQVAAGAQVVVPGQPTNDPSKRRDVATKTSSEQLASAIPQAPRPLTLTQPQWNVVQPQATPAQFETHKFVSSTEADPLLAARLENVGSTTAPHQHTLPTRMDLPHHVARQIADALQQMPNRPVEIMLSPEELGRVRLGVSTSEGNILVSVLAERPETTDLMRRHINALETAFQELGYSNINFSFAGDRSAEADGSDQQQDGPQDNWASAQDIAPDITQIKLSSAPISGVDIRL